MASPFRFASEFELVAQDRTSGLRAGLFHTPHGTIATPAFMPVGTLASVKSLTPEDVAATGARCLLANTYHLVLRPGLDTVRRLGGLHAMMRWDGPILTDSGGFQVFSLGGLRQVSDAGVQFHSHLDGGPVFFSPESVTAAQEALGSDLVMPLDECIPAAASRSDAERALARTTAWRHRGLAARRRDDQTHFALLQGGMFADLRRQAAVAAAAERPPGFAIGGLSVGEPKDVTTAMLEITVAQLPRDIPRYLMGVGAPDDLTRYARLGIDLFDCVLPTRLARNGVVWSSRDGAREDLNRRTALGKRGPILPGCSCLACARWSVGALAGLFRSRSELASRLASLHNLTVLADLLAEMRAGLLAPDCDGARERVVYT